MNYYNIINMSASVCSGLAAGTLISTRSPSPCNWRVIFVFPRSSLSKSKSPFPPPHESLVIENTVNRINNLPVNFSKHWSTQTVPQSAYYSSI